MLQNKQNLIGKKNILAFSAGGDSTALLFLLMENNISFDIAIVNYKLRKEAELEVAYALSLAKKYNFTCHLHTPPKIINNFEANARKLRYDFFDSLIDTYQYENLLTAHHLGDRFEWMLMQFCKGSGCIELAGMKTIEVRENYTLIRPLLHLQKQELLSYLKDNDIRYFEDSSNLDQSYKRNEFRHNYASPLLKKYSSGIKKSFEYMDLDREEILKDIKLHTFKEFSYFKTSSSKRSNIVTIDQYFKSIGLLITANEKSELREKETVIISRRWVVSSLENYTLIMPFKQNIKLSKEFKEKMRLLKISPKMRAYLSTKPDVVALVSGLLQ